MGIRWNFTWAPKQPLRLRKYNHPQEIAPSNREPESIDKVLTMEYQEALAQTRAFATLMRTDVAFATTVQAAILAVIGSHLPLHNIGHTALSVLAFTVAVLGINSVDRVYRYMSGYMSRAREIETKLDLKLIAQGYLVTKNRFNLPIASTFKYYYALLIVFWMIIWGWSLISTSS